MAIPRWAQLLFGTLEPLVNVATAVFITCNAALFNQLLFAAAPSGSEVDLALARMYASVLLCFGLCQYCAWSTWAADENAKPRVRAWTLMMLVPDAHHLAFAYGLYLRGPHGRYDVAFAAHYAIQGALTIARLALLASTAAGTLTGTGPVGSAIQGSLDAIFSPRVDRSLPADLRLDGVTVAITGASRGLGLAVAKAVARRGATVVALNRTLVAETEAILKEEGAAAATAAVAVDLESVASVDAAVAELKRRRITVDRLVLNAGMLPIASRPSKDGADVMLQVNVLSSARLIEMMRGSGVLSQTRAASRTLEDVATSAQIDYASLPPVPTGRRLEAATAEHETCLDQARQVERSRTRALHAHRGRALGENGDYPGFQGGSDAPVVDEDVDSALERRSQAMRDREAQVAQDWAAVENLVELARSYAKTR